MKKAFIALALIALAGLSGCYVPAPPPPPPPYYPAPVAYGPPPAPGYYAAPVPVSIGFGFWGHR